MSHGRSAGVSVYRSGDGTVKYTAYSNPGKGGDKGMRVSVTRDSTGNVVDIHSTDQSSPKGDSARHR